MSLLSYDPGFTPEMLIRSRKGFQHLHLNVFSRENHPDFLKNVAYGLDPEEVLADSTWNHNGLHHKGGAL